MDGFALARIRARRTREEHGGGLVSALSVVTHALAQLSFQVSTVPPDSPLLKGADARLRRPWSTVIVRNDVPDGERACHLAHELGHVVLHKPTECCELEATDLSATGSRAMARVEAYGPRERRELHANVFGREFLLPRELARFMFLEDRLPASEIASRLGLPLSLVRRQLLDAILQRDAEFEDEPAPAKPFDLDPSQVVAAHWEGPALLVEAGPGSGKTKTLVARIEHLLSGRTPPEEILALTFSNKAAAELADRVAQKRPDDAVKIWTGTFHAFGLDLMRRYYDRIGLEPKIRLVSPSQAVELLEERLPLLGLRHFHDLRNPASKLKDLMRPIQRAKDEVVGPEEFRALADAALADAIDERQETAALKTLEAADLYDAYEDLLRRRGLVDFGDLVMRTTRLLEEDPTVRATIQAQYREVLVDEYQDMNRASARMLKALYTPGVRMWVVGDARQSIYRFRGASSRNMGRFEADFEGGDRRPLSFNYRSTEHVTGLCKTFAAFMDREKAAAIDADGEKGLPYEARSKRTDAGTPTRILVGGDDACEADLLVQEIRALEKTGVKLSEQTVLARANSRLDKLAAELAERGVPALHLGSFFERDEVRDVLSVLALVAEPNGAALVRVAANRDVMVEAADIAVVVAAARARGEPLAAVLLDAKSITGLSPSGSDALVRLGDRVRELGPRTPAFEVAAQWLLDRSDYLRHLSEPTGIEADLCRAALWQLLEFLDQSELDGRPLTSSGALRRVRTVILLADDRDLREPDLGGKVDAVRLMTVHAAKGLEYKATHVVGLHEYGFPLKIHTDPCLPPPGIVDARDPRSAHDEEERCAFFVALSRAEDHLRLYHTLKAEKAPRKPSPFLDTLGRLDVATLSSSSVVKGVPTFDLGGHERDTLTLHDVRDHEKCPLRLAYRYHLGVRARRHEGPFLRTSGVLYAVLDRLSEAVAAGADLGETLQAVFNEVWEDLGPVEHDFAGEYRSLAQDRIGALALLASGFESGGSEPIAVAIEGGRVLVPPPLLSPDDGGGRTARFFAAGKKDSEIARRVTTGLLVAAAQATAGRVVSVEVAHLTDGVIIPLTPTGKRVQADIAKAGEMLSAVRTGRLAPIRSMFTCGRCGHFFSCPATGARRPA